MSLFPPRSNVDLAATDPLWWWRTRRPVLTASLLTEQGASRQQVVYTSPFPVRLAHDIWLSVSAIPSTLASAQGYAIDFSCLIEAAPSASSTEEVAPDTNDASWDENLGFGMEVDGFNVIELSSDQGEKYTRPLFEPRTSYDQDGTYDFIRLRLTANTVGNWTGKVVVDCQMWVNEQALAMNGDFQEVSSLNQSTLLTDVTTGEAI